MRKAKIVCTIGPASGSRKIISSLIKNGMDVARLNFSHGDYKFHQTALTLVRREAIRQKRTVSVLQDLQGIKIRIGDVYGGAVKLKTGGYISLFPGTGVSDESKLFISYPALLKDIEENEKVLIDDGIIKLSVTDRSGNSLRAKIIEGGILKPRKGVNLPSSKITLQSFTDKDRRDLGFGIKMGVDYVAISFVRTADDIYSILQWAKRRRLELPPLIAKIEKPEALNNINEIMDLADGIMVARGDLGVEMPAERVPIIQKMLIDLANKKGKLVITATQMLESMTEHTRPTRAEASDVANAVLDGTDALMLSAETASGKYPVESVRMMDTIIKYTEENFSHKIESLYQIGKSFPEAAADGALHAARDIGAKAVVVFTNKGFTASLISKLKPDVPVIAFTPYEKTLKRMPLYWGVSGRLIGERGDSKVLGSGIINEIKKKLLREKFIKKRDGVVFVASSPFLGEPNIIRLLAL